MAGTILIVDDSTSAREQIVQILKETPLFDRYLEAKDGIDGLKILLNTPVDLILCDLEMPRMDGFKFISMIHTREELKHIPVIMLTGREDRELKIRGLEQGASDYVTKPFDAGELVARVKVHLKFKALQDDLKKSNELLTELSNTDPLTKLYNRRYLMESLEKEFQRTKRKGRPLSLIMLDIDYFKKINDTYGHQEGDLVLASLAAVTKKELRSYDLAARYGGEEFTLVLPETSLQQALVVAERLRKNTQGLSFSDRLQDVSLTISLGVAAVSSAEADSVDALIRRADEALYRAKQNGRNRVEVMAG